MKKKNEILKNSQLKQMIINQLESCLGVRLTESQNIALKEYYELPIYIDLEEYNDEKLSDIVEENYEEIEQEIKNSDYIDTFSYIFNEFDNKHINISFRVSNRDEDGDECINILIGY